MAIKRILKINSSWLELFNFQNHFKPQTSFLTCFCRGERRKYTGKKSRLYLETFETNIISDWLNYMVNHSKLVLLSNLQNL